MPSGRRYAWGTGRDDGGVEEVVAQLLAQPKEVTYVGRSWDAVELHLERHDTLVAALNDEVDLMVPISGPQVVHGGLARLGIDPGTQGHERLEQRPEECPVAWISGPTLWPRKRAPASTPTRWAARAGSARWCFGAWVSRRKWFRFGTQPGTGSSSHSWERTSRYAVVVVFAGLVVSRLWLHRGVSCNWLSSRWPRAYADNQACNVAGRRTRRPCSGKSRSTTRAR